MKLFCFGALLFFLSSVCYGQEQQIRLIVRGDDMGVTHSMNEAIVECLQAGVETTVEVIVPSPWFPEAVALLKKFPHADVGVHIALTSEWDNLKYRPLTHCPSLSGEDGYFFPFIWPNKNYPGQALLEHSWSIAEIEHEFRAQIETAKKKIPGITHLTAHMGCYDMHPDVKALIVKLAKEYGVDIDPAQYGVVEIGYKGAHGTAREKQSSFLAALETMTPGNTYLFVDHPGKDSPELRGLFHAGYENVAADRQGVTSLLTSEKVKKAIAGKNIKLIGYRDLK